MALKLKKIQRMLAELLEKSDFSVQTFLALGAILQILALTYLPPRVATLPPLLCIAYRFLKAVIASRDPYRTTFTDVTRGVHVTKLPREHDGVVLFVLGVRYNHPFGKLAPGMATLDVYFRGMWREAEQNRQKWGYLGRTATLIDTSDTLGTTAVYLSYWRDLQSLHAFARSKEHKLGMDSARAGKFPYAGLFHETYHAPRGKSEAIYNEFRRWGLGNVEYPVESGDGKEETKVVLRPIDGNNLNMYARMADQE